MKKFIAIFFALFSVAVLTLTFLLVTHSVTKSQKNSQIQANNLSADSLVSIKIIAAGDLMIHQKQLESGYDKESKTYQFNTCFEQIKETVKEADFSIVNFEAAIGDKPYRGFPYFSTPDTLAYAAKYAGFNITLTANNHALDKGSKGLIANIMNLQKQGLLTTGTFLDSSDRKNRNLLLLQKKGIKIALLNYSYGTNGIPVPQPFIVNTIDTNLMRDDINNAKLQKPDLIIVCLHWGEEYQRKPNGFQKRIADFLIENDVDAIIGSHPHVVQPIEIRDIEKNGKKKKVIIAYSLGNFISNQKIRYRDGGIMLDFIVKKNLSTQKVEIDSIAYLPVYVSCSVEKGKRNYVVLPANKMLNNQLSFDLDKNNLSRLKRFVSDTKEMMTETHYPLIEK